MLPSHRSIDEVWVLLCNTQWLGQSTDCRVIQCAAMLPLVALEHRHCVRGHTSSPIVDDAATSALRPCASGRAAGAEPGASLLIHRDLFWYCRISSLFPPPSRHRDGEGLRGSPVIW